MESGLKMSEERQNPSTSRRTTTKSKIEDQRKSHHDDVNPPDLDSKSRITWRRPFDFTLTVVGYTVGIHDFWKFPYMCYKYGGVFFIPFWIVMFLFYIPGVFMEFTLGQYHGVGSMQVFGELAPILTGVSYILAWNSLTSCWLYAMMISWSRLYSDDATSCKQGWRTCHQANYYNSEACYTGTLDKLCELQDVRLRLNQTAASGRPAFRADYKQLYYDFTCYNLTQFCDKFNSTPIIGTKTCRDKNTRKTFSVHTKRVHASMEYFYGGLCGLKKKDLTRNSTHKSYQYTKDPESASEDELFIFCLTTFVIIGYFLHEGLLAVSFVTYLLNAAPFIALLYFTFLALALPHSLAGLLELSSISKDFSALADPAIWVDAIVQVISCTGIGNGVLINLSTFNAKEHNYMHDTLTAALLNSFCSTCATVICFCAIGHTRVLYKMQHLPFKEYLIPEASHSSLEFGYIIYTQFLTLIGDEAIPVLAFFFMITSFSMDSALRLIQNTLDAVTYTFPRLRRHRLASLIAICLFSFAATLPMTRNGGVLLFWEYEYFLMKFVWPTMAFIQIFGVTWIYKTGRMLDNAEEMGVISSIHFRRYMIVCLQFIFPISLLFVLGFNAYYHSSTKFIQHTDRRKWNDLFGFILIFLPLIIFLLSLIEQYAITPKGRISSLFYPPARRSSVGRSLRRRTGLSLTNYGAMSLHATVKTAAIFKPPPQAIEKAISKWRKGGLTGLRRNTSGSGGRKASFAQPENVMEEIALANETGLTRRRTAHQQPAEEEVQLSPSEESASESLDELLKLAYKDHIGDARERVQYGRWKQAWKRIVRYLDKWPGRFDDDSEVSESSSESSSDDTDEDDAAADVKNPGDSRQNKKSQPSEK